MLNAILKKRGKVNENELYRFKIPDRYSFYIDRNFGILFSKDSDFFHNSNIAVFLEGRIYNFKDNKISKRISKLYKRYGTEFIKNLNGHFALLIWDKEKKRLFVAIDRLGLKDIFYYKTSNDNFFFSSRIRPLLDLPDYRISIDENSLANYLCYQFVPKPSTLFKGIKKIPTSEVLSFKEGKVSMKNYWNIVFKNCVMNEEKYANELRRILIKSIKLRIPEEKRIGLLLSGGLDSTIIASVLKNNIENDRIISFTGGFEGYDEYGSFEYGQRVADILGIENKKVVIDENIIEKLPELYSFLDEPLADSAIMQSYALLSVAKRSVSNVFSGEFSDILFGGMQNYLKSKIEEEFWYNIPEKDRFAAETNPGSPLVKEFIHKIKNKAKFMHYKFGEVFFDEKEIGNISKDSYYNELRFDLSKPIRKVYESCNESDRFNKKTYTDIKVAAQRRLFHLTEPAKLHKIELILPFTDNNLIDCSLKIPSELKINERMQKYILRKAFRGYIPDFVLTRDKEGFTPPFHLWYGKSYEWIMDYLNSFEFSFLDNSKIKKYVKGILESKTDVYEKNMAVWIIINLAAWYNSLITPRTNKIVLKNC
jgi:asparagine synthase (glutamine-hydrolysing)